MTYRPNRACISLIGKIAFAAIIVFSAGPDLGSIDADHDGSPEVPVIVLHSSNAAKDRYTVRQDQQITVSTWTVSALSTALRDDSGHFDRTFLAERNLPLSLFALSLRC